MEPYFDKAMTPGTERGDGIRRQRLATLEAGSLPLTPFNPRREDDL